MRSKVLLLATFILISTSVHAEEPNTALALRLVDILNPYQKSQPGTDKLLEQSVELQVKAKTLGMTLSESQRSALEPIKRTYINRLKRSSDWEDKRKSLAYSYAKVFTKEQLQKLISMYTDELFLMHAQQRELISEAIYNEFQVEQAKDQAWFEAQVNKVIIGE